MKVFVYGTLKRGYGNNRLLSSTDAHFVSDAFTTDTFDMINSGFPVLVPNDKGMPVKGEVWDIGTNQEILESLDRLEGEGVMYDRREIVVVPTPRHEGDQITCSVYIGNPRYWGRKVENAGKDLTDTKYIRDGAGYSKYLEWSR